MDMDQVRQAAQNVVANTPLNGPQPAGIDELREALAETPPVAVAEDPVREAARRVSEVEELQQSGWYKSEIRALREALDQPAPPSLTEDERKALRYAVAQLSYSGVAPMTTLQACKSAREKLS